jgi:hypothetical protein
MAAKKVNPFAKMMKAKMGAAPAKGKGKMPPGMKKKAC